MTIQNQQPEKNLLPPEELRTILAVQTVKTSEFTKAVRKVCEIYPGATIHAIASVDSFEEIEKLEIFSNVYVSSHLPVTIKAMGWKQVWWACRTRYDAIVLIQPDELYRLDWDQMVYVLRPKHNLEIDKEGNLIPRDKPNFKMFYLEAPAVWIDFFNRSYSTFLFLSFTTIAWGIKTKNKFFRIFNNQNS